ncbi:hypothetical protein IDH01_01060 [Pelagibacterales bacterium SAG-MED08]|nr:hypothetical protein [Pelagibacterales bacterium SAG-MED08]|tara:strand:+ start:834 stop:2102 length:1269 start_codon:yes stop_codon:yes gene_type:complete
MNIKIFKDKTILTFFTLSIFFSHVQIFNFQLRFLYLFLFIFMLIDFKKNFSKINLNYLLYSFIFSILLFIYSIFNLSNFDFLELKKVLNLFLKILIFFLTINLVTFYKEILIKNISKMIEIFLYIFFIYIVYSIIIDIKNPREILPHCLNFFFFSKALYSEVSHFHMMSIPIIFYLISNYKEFFKKKINILLSVLFFIFTFKNFSLLLFLGIIGSTIILFLTFKNFNRKTLFLLLFINLISLVIFLNEKSCPKNILNEVNNDNAMISTAKDKLLNTGILSKEDKNLSYLVYINSLNVSFQSLKDNLFGLGFDNYKYAHLSNRYHNYNPGESENNMKFRNFNIYDGSFNLSKLTTEFGLFFIICIIFVIFRSFSNQFTDPEKAFIYTFLFLQTFLRGSGIFYNGYLIISIILIDQLLVRYNKK